MEYAEVCAQCKRYSYCGPEFYTHGCTRPCHICKKKIKASDVFTYTACSHDDAGTCNISVTWYFCAPCRKVAEVHLYLLGAYVDLIFQFSLSPYLVYA